MKKIICLIITMILATTSVTAYSGSYNSSIVSRVELDNNTTEEDILFGYAYKFSKNENGKTLKGIKNFNGEILKPAKYDEIVIFEDIVVLKEENKQIVLDKNLKELFIVDTSYIIKQEIIYTGKVLEAVYDDIISVSNSSSSKIYNLAENKFIEVEGNPQRISISAGSQYGVAIKNESGKIAIINRNGDLITDYNYNNVPSIYGNTSVHTVIGQDGLIYEMLNLKTGELLGNYNEIDITNDKKYAIATQNNTKTLYALDNQKKILTLGDYEVDEVINENLIITSKQDGDKSNQGVIDSKQNQIISNVYDDIRFELGNFTLQKDDKVGIYSESGEEILPIKYNSIEVLPNGHYITSNDGKYTLLDKNKKVVVTYDIIYKINDSLLQAVNERKYFFVLDYSGKEIIKGTAVVEEKNNLLLGESNSKAGLITTNGEVVIPFEYTYMDFIGDNYIFATKVDKSYVFKYKNEQLKKNAKFVSTNILLNDKKISLEAYNIDNNYYFKLRDIASILNGTEKQFDVKWDNEKQAINIITGKSYEGTMEMAQNKNLIEKQAEHNYANAYIDGFKINLNAYNIDDNNYFKLRDIADEIGFLVDWDKEKNIILIKTK